MAKDIEINSVEYNGAKKVDIPLADGTGKAHFYETSEDTVQADHVVAGETFHGADGAGTGTMTDNGTMNATIDDVNDVVNIAEGYHSGSGTVSIDPTERAKFQPENIMLGTTLLGTDGTGNISNIVTNWLADHISNPSSPPLDASLTLGSAAAQAKAVGDMLNECIARRPLPTVGNLDSITLPGFYWIGASASADLDNYPAEIKGTVGGRLLVAKTANSAQNAVQILFARDDAHTIYVRMSNGSTNPVWDEWRTISTSDQMDQTLMYRGGLTASSDLDSITLPGSYYVSNANAGSIGNYPPTTSGGRLLVIKSKSSFYNAVQFLFAGDGIRSIYYRMSNGVGSWSEWMSIGASARREIELTPVPRNFSTGYLAAGMASAESHRSTGCYLDIHNAARVSIAFDDENRTAAASGLYIYVYGEDFVLMTQKPVYPAAPAHSSPCAVNLPDGARYIVPLLVIAGGDEMSTRITVDAIGTDTIDFCKNDRGGGQLDSGFYRFGYQVMPDVYNTGRILLPPGYSPHGQPVPVILNVHGSGSYLYANDDESQSYWPYYNYLADMGYAVIDCWGWTSRYSSTAAGYDNPWPMPTTIAAYLSLMDFVTRNFNVDENQMYTLSKSLGGYVNSFMASTGLFRACGFLAPALVLLGGGSKSGNDIGYAVASRTAVAEDFGLEGDVEKFIGADGLDFADNAERKAFYMQNLSKICGWIPEWRGMVGLTAEEKLDNDIANRHVRTDLWKVGYSPVKIWIADDDTSVRKNPPIEMVAQLQNAGTEAERRVMPANTGGHHAVDTHGLSPIRENVVTRSGAKYTSVPAAYAEAVEFYEKHAAARGEIPAETVTLKAWCQNKIDKNTETADNSLRATARCGSDESVVWLAREGEFDDGEIIHEYDLNTIDGVTIDQGGRLSVDKSVASATKIYVTAAIVSGDISQGSATVTAHSTVVVTVK